ncbi:MAG TPA: thiolase domain-containing protein [Thermoplasmatales archaeon]|nr:thiolase domain-containing protein [Candidatus Thermoplasmatota archaeon]MDD5778675.1 thiolase domain-containing protein [Candidatus Thermoplasmatota archaeon]HDS58900.1 thiolase domain-containing protein [Thermoplasmatales archaeon]
MREVALIGSGVTEFGELWEKSLADLVAEAGITAIMDAGIDGTDIDALYIGGMSAGRFVGQEHLGSLAAEVAGLSDLHIPATRVEAACASGGLALHSGYLAVASGAYDVVVVGGAEKMTDVPGTEATNILASAANREWEAFFGATFPGLYALMARYHMHKHGTTSKQLAQVAVKNHHNGTLNPKAQYQRKISVEDVLNSTMVADPLHLLDCSPITDGAAAVVVASVETARQFTDQPVRIMASCHASDSISLSERSRFDALPAAVSAARCAYRQAGVEPTDIDFAEVHDCFTIAEIMAIEDLGFVDRGQGGPATEDGLTARDGDIPVNTSGGLKSKGHPVGATGIAQIHELMLQLRGQAGQRQVEKADIGLSHNVGGSGGTAVIHILEAI